MLGSMAAVPAAQCFSCQLTLRLVNICVAVVRVLL